MSRITFTDLPENLLNESVKRFHNGEFDALYPNRRNYYEVKSQIEAYQQSFTLKQRANLILVLKEQYTFIKLSPKQLINLAAFATNDGFAVTTGQQIHPFLGPAFVWAKVQSTLTRAEQLSQYTGKTVVPIFWMASEDHDFDEISRIPFLGKTYTWEYNGTGPVGTYDTEGLHQIWLQMNADFQHDEKVVEFLKQFEGIYQKGRTLAEATILLIQHYFGDTGLLVIDPNNVIWKKQMVDIWLSELTSLPYEVMKLQAQKMKDLGLKVPITPRRTNLFYYGNNQRLRVDFIDENTYQTADLSFKWDTESLKAELQTYPERFSTNALLRPVYQQKILPNLAYIGGPAECIYWLQVPTLMEHHGVVVPILDLRMMMVAIPNGAQKKLTHFSWMPNEWFQSEEVLIKQFIEKEQGDLALTKQIPELKKQFEHIWDSLYQLKHPELKSIKKQHEEVIKHLNQIGKQFLETGLETHLAPKIKQIKQIKETVFNEKTPAERTTFWFEWQFKYQINISSVEVENYFAIIQE